MTSRAIQPMRLVNFPAVLVSACLVMASFVPPAELAEAQTVATQSGQEAGLSRVAETFSGSTSLSDGELTTLLSEIGVTASDFAPGRKANDSVGFAIYDRAVQTIVRSYNIDKSFDLASTTKLFTMAVVGKTFRGDALIRQHRADFARFLRNSDNRGASPLAAPRQ